MRLFLHWCQPRIGGHTTDLDLSVGFYDANWQYAGVCSYYQLKFKLRRGKKNEIAVSAGDRQDAPYPNGATEFIDLHRDRSLDHGLRYAVMVVNAYAGLPFSRLDRCFAGLMLRDEVGGKHFDPSTVELKFDLQGERGIYLPFVLDIEENHLHWLDVFSKGQFIFNNVETSNRAITRICPDLLAYFGSGIRLSMYELALLHAAARGKKVLLRSETIELFERRPDEDVLSYYSRRANPVGGQGNVGLPRPGDGPVFAALFKGDIELGDESVHYALFRESLVGSISASDLIAGE